jgi:CspA family cold shock protein
MEKKQSGTVKCWRNTWGFITPDDGGANIFVHQSGIEMAGYRELVPGQKVSFDIGENERGPAAVRVELKDDGRGG